MKFRLTLLLLFIAGLCTAQQKINQRLKQQLDSVYALDQKYRAMLTYMGQPQNANVITPKIKVSIPQAAAMLQTEQQRLDSLNLIFISSVIARYGYPGKTLVGEAANEVAWNVIDHANKIPEYLPMIKQAADIKEIPFYLYAAMLDRYLADQGKEQLYGSQCTCRVLKSGSNECFVWPIEDAATVNERRKKAGFKLTVEQSAELLGVQYRVIKLEEINREK